MKFIYFCLVAAACVAVAYASCSQRTINVDNIGDLANAMKKAQPGDIIIVAPGEYKIADSLVFGGNGVEGCPINLTCAKKGLCDLIGKMVLNDVSYVFISGFNVNALDAKGYQYNTCFQINRGKNVTIDHVHAYNGKNNGILFTNAEYGLVQYCEFDHTDRAVVVSDSGFMVVDHFFFGDYIATHAVEIIRTADVYVIYNDIFGHNSYNNADAWFLDDYGSVDYAYNSFFNPDPNVQVPAAIKFVNISSEYGPAPIYYNYVVLQKGATAFVGCNNEKKIVCASNIVIGGGQVTDGKIDPTC